MSTTINCPRVAGTYRELIRLEAVRDSALVAYSSGAVPTSDAYDDACDAVAACRSRITDFDAGRNFR